MVSGKVFSGQPSMKQQGGPFFPIFCPSLGDLGSRDVFVPLLRALNQQRNEVPKKGKKKKNERNTLAHKSSDNETEVKVIFGDRIIYPTCGTTNLRSKRRHRMLRLP